MSLVRLQIRGISYSQTQNGAYALILNEEHSSRKLPIVIGAYEAQAIAMELEKRMVPPRPLTHDLFKNFADKFHITIKQVIIYKLVDGVFHSSLICEQNGIEEILDARTSDAIALALRFNAPIFTYKDILEKAGIYLSAVGKSEISDAEEVDNMADTNKNMPTESHLSKHSLQELNRMLEESVALEDYEMAAKIRDEISKRSDY